MSGFAVKEASGRSRIRRAKSDVVFDTLNTAILLLTLVLVLYPLYFIVIASVSDPDMVNAGEVLLLPRGMTLDGYKNVLDSANFWRGYKNTLFYLVLGTGINLALTMTGAYALSRRELVIRKPVMKLITFTMIFSGGLIPTFLTVRDYGLYDSIWALIIPNAVSAYNLIVCRTFLESNIPQELIESAQIDGCSDARFFFHMVLPLSPAIIAVMTLFYGVGHWNSWFNALIYLQDTSLNPLQIELRELLLSARAAASAGTLEADTLAEKQRAVEMMKYAVILVSSLPIMCVYPFLQKYFVKGVMIGAIKG